ncbi:50S ribosomal protein L29 [Buchnera aphidicola]|uniref:Large ribosomal subunit protein uL29 n=1 Tax=Buchnera aphidicola subsp. Tuberolachnus salignus TaxID=98804 RepID=A0A170PC91_BUCTT|nr:50S ribosomal protein L29 [Buchnera aphidicola]CUR53313.1 50S ribosomal protein L29 [Buchnera aphidicola (Tuberolachnus salignus)]
MLKYQTLKNKTISELKILLLDFLRENFNLRMQISSGKLKQTHLLRKVRKNIARLKTFIITQKVISS